MALLCVQNKYILIPAVCGELACLRTDRPLVLSVCPAINGGQVQTAVRTAAVSQLKKSLAVINTNCCERHRNSQSDVIILITSPPLYTAGLCTFAMLFATCFVLHLDIVRENIHVEGVG